MDKYWKLEDVAVAHKAYANATSNLVAGTNQDLNKVSLDLYEVFKRLPPKNCGPGRYFHRDINTIYPHLCDCVFPQVQKFQKSL